jgi:hypothetical protein
MTVLVKLSGGRLAPLVVGLVALLHVACSHRVPVLPDPPDGGQDDASLADLGDGPRPLPDVNQAAAGFIYVVDDDGHLRRYHPTTNVFSQVGYLGCPAVEPFATPFSMGVDHDARAWVLYSSGELFWVDTEDASCKPCPFVPEHHGLDLFGMGFVADGPESLDEKLFIATGAGQTSYRQLAIIDPQTLQLTSVSPLPLHEHTPELTGTRNGELFGYFPGTNETMVSQFNKQTGEVLKSWPLAPLSSDVTAWAFAHWGGRFYIFVTAGASRVIRLDPATGKAQTIKTDLPFHIVGAGVSSVAPVTHPDLGPAGRDAGPP